MYRKKFVLFTSSITVNSQLTITKILVLIEAYKTFKLALAYHYIYHDVLHKSTKYFPLVTGKLKVKRCVVGVKGINVPQLLNIKTVFRRRFVLSHNYVPLTYTLDLGMEIELTKHTFSAVLTQNLPG